MFVLRMLRSQRCGMQSFLLSKQAFCLPNAFTRAFSGHLEATYKQLRLGEFEVYRKENPTWGGPYATSSTLKSCKPTLSISQFTNKFASALDHGARRVDLGEHTLTGRVIRRREASKNLLFLDIRMDRDIVQILVSKHNYATDADRSLTRMIRRGDIVSVRGFPGKTNTGELSLIAREVTLLTPCLHEIPERLDEPNARYRKKYLDMIVHTNKTHRVAWVRAIALRCIRQILSEELQFVEVKTPIIWTSHGGATAKPFLTSSSALAHKLPLYLRIAPELFLKQLVVGGLSRVFEVGKVFRNEGIDHSHNPEFTMIELYQAYADYEDLMDLTERLLRAVERSVREYDEQHSSSSSSCGLLFEAPFDRVEVVPALQHALQVSELPDFNDERNLDQYLALCKQHDIEVQAPLTISHCLDKLIGKLVEPSLIRPTFLMHHPMCMSPLSKAHDTLPGVCERFELYVNGTELVNAYSELTQPQQQQLNFQQQQQQQQQHSPSSSSRAAAASVEEEEDGYEVDHEYVQALEFGLPPTAGWGLGLDRLIMLLCDIDNIREILLFPIVKPEHHNHHHPTPPLRDDE